MLRHMEVRPVRISFQSPWQNGVAERWVGSCRRELLDHVIVVNEQHLRRLLREFLEYTGWTHRGINRAANTAGKRAGAMRQARATVTPSNRTDLTQLTEALTLRLITLAERLGPDEVAVLAVIAIPEAQ